ncbi:hypothetical protein [Neoroseomonas lacus]|uniref:Phage late control D family protein n=1 Tax=Neoroseomonas lacus TaxID=287609 RepID=A0A917K8Q4_9PROT|nr:hypothetical protein [Neoroseomonas lacus]GGJ02355.1 hypothetical protein GCM10011320_06490 [Neoroseomonas lacus]
MTYTFRPNAVLTLDGRSFTAAEAGLVELEMETALGELGELRLLLWPGSKLADATPGARLELALGATDSEAAVFTGVVEHVARTATTVMVDALEPTVALHRAFLSRAYLNQTVAAIVRDLAGPVSVAEADSDLELGQYGVENRRSVWWHLRDLAMLAGCDLAAAVDGGLVFRPRGRGDAHGFRYGADLLGFTDGQSVEATAPAQAAHGSASSAGTDRWHWVNADPLGPASEPARIRGAIASEAAADAATEAARARAAARAKCGRIALWGRPELRPGDGVDLQDMPGGEGGLLGAATAAVAGLGGGAPGWRATRVRHAFGRSTGFVTLAELEGGGDSAGGFP